MLNLSRGVFPLRFAAALAAVLLLLGVASPAWADVTQAQCSAEWAESDADETCSNEEIVVQDDGDCQITASCTMDNGGSRNDSFAAALNKISTLVNCNGLLKLEACAGD